jgi:hypothetical protein
LTGLVALVNAAGAQRPVGSGTKRKEPEPDSTGPEPNSVSRCSVGDSSAPLLAKKRSPQHKWLNTLVLAADAHAHPDRSVNGEKITRRGAIDSLGSEDIAAIRRHYFEENGEGAPLLKQVSEILLLIALRFALHACSSMSC